MNARCLVRSGRSSVTLKKNRSAETVTLIFGVPAPLDIRCSQKARTSSDLAVSGDRPRNAVLDPLHVVMLGFWRELADRHVFDHAPTQRADGLIRADGSVAHGDAPVLSEVLNPSISRQDAPFRYGVGRAAGRSALPRERFSPLAHCRDGGRPSWRPVIEVLGANRLPLVEAVISSITRGHGD